MSFKERKTKPILFYVDDNNCFICTSHARDLDGYPLIKRKKTIRISRYIYEECFGFIPDNHLVRHTCDNPNCISPEHLITGTHKQNSEDMVSRNRSARGEKNGSAKLTTEDVLRIRETYKRGIVRLKDLAIENNVSIVTISDIVNENTWRHI